MHSTSSHAPAPTFSCGRARLCRLASFRPTPSLRTLRWASASRPVAGSASTWRSTWRWERRPTTCATASSSAPDGPRVTFSCFSPATAPCLRCAYSALNQTDHIALHSFRALASLRGSCTPRSSSTTFPPLSQRPCCSACPWSPSGWACFPSSSTRRYV